MDGIGAGNTHFFRVRLLYLDRFKGGRSTLSPVRIAIDPSLLPFKGIPGFDKLLRKHA